MGVRKSEYGRSYIKSPKKYLAKEFEGKLDYRMYRRQLEQRHTPFDWENGMSGLEEELDTIRSSLYDDRLNPHPLQEPKHIKKFKELKQMYESVEKKQVPCRTPPNSLEVEDPDVLEGPTDPETESDTVVPDSAHLYKNVNGDKPKLSKAKKNQNNSAEKACKTQKKKERESKPSKKCSKEKLERPVRPSKYRKIPKPKPVSAPTGRPAKRSPPPPADSEERPPFVPFGRGDMERSTGTLKTHNVRASADIYPSAVRAQKRKEAEIQHQLERVQSAPLRERRKESLFNDIMNRQTSSWGTEYRQNYAGYEASEYARNISNRTPGGERFYITL